MSRKCMYCTILIVIGFASGSELLDATRAVGESAEFNCELTGTVLYWRFNGIAIYDYQNGEDAYHTNKKDKYDVTHDNRNFKLTVKDLEYSDGGRYTCDMGAEAHAILIVLGTPSVTPKTTNFEEGNTVTYSCEARYGGPRKSEIAPYHYPLLTMWLGSFKLQGSTQGEESDGSVAYHLLRQDQSITLNIDNNRKSLSCEVKTAYPEAKVKNSTTVTVLYPVRNMDYYPKQQHYEIGDVINCTADGNPMPSIHWQHTENSELFTPNGRLEMTEEMTGSNVWKCAATNTINEELHEDEITIAFDAGTTKIESSNAIYVTCIVIALILNLAIGIGLLWYFKLRKKKTSNGYDLVPMQDSANCVCGVWVDEDDSSGKEIVKYVEANHELRFKRADFLNLLQTGLNYKQYMVLLSERSYQNPHFKHCTSTLYHLHYMEQISMVVSVIIDERFQDKHLPIHLESFQRVISLPPHKDNELKKICNELAEPLADPRADLPAGNVGIGLAWSYYYGYLKLILPELQNRIRKSKVFKGHEKRMSKQFIIIIPESCQTPASFNDADDRFSPEGPLDDGITQARAGQPTRTYKTFVSKVEADQKGDLYFCGEFATPVLALQKMCQDPSCRMDKKEMQKQLVLFRHTLMSILNQKGNKECRGRTYIHTYVDTDEYVNLADQIYDIIDREIKGNDIQEDKVNDNKKLPYDSVLLQDQKDETKGSAVSLASTDSMRSYTCFKNVTLMVGEDTKSQLWEENIRSFCAMLQGHFDDAAEDESDEGLHCHNNLSPLYNDKVEAEKYIIILTEDSPEIALNFQDWLKEPNNLLEKAICIADLPKERIKLLTGTSMKFVDTRKSGNTWKEILDFLLGIPVEHEGSVQYRIDRRPIGNVAEGLAWAYYHNYLALIGSNVADRMKATKHYRHGKMPTKLFILLPYSGYCHASVKDADKTIENDGTMEILNIPLSGNKRTYNTTRYKIIKNKQEIFACIEYCAPVLVIYEMKKNKEAGLTETEKANQLYMFYRVLQAILNHPHAPQYLQNFQLVHYNDEGDTPLSDILFQQIQDCIHGSSKGQRENMV